MKNPAQLCRDSRGFRKPLLILSFAALPLGLAQAQTWNGGGADGKWTNGANWGGTAPVVGTTTNLTFAGATNLTAQNDFAAGSNFGAITFAAGASAFTLTGNQLILNGNITNSSSVQQTIGASLNLNLTARNAAVGTAGLRFNSGPIGVTASRELTCDGGPVVLGGTWDNNNAFFAFTINTGSLSFAPSAAVTMGATNTAQNLIIIRGGATGGIATGQSFTGRGLIKVGNTNTTMATDAVFNMTGGTLTLSTTGASGQARIGIGEPSAGVGKSIFNMSGGILNMPGAGANDGLFIGVRSHSKADFSGGTTTTPRFLMGWTGAIALQSTTRELLVRGNASVTFSNTANIGSGNTATAGIRNTTITLGDTAGGTATLSTVAFSGGDAAAGTAWNNVLNWNGGVLKFLGAGGNGGALTNYLGNTDTVNVGANGAIVDSNGISATITQNLLGGAGGLEKRGAGVLTLAGSGSTFAGPVTIKAGTLAVTTAGNGGAASSLGASSNAAANLVFDGGSLGYSGATAAGTDRNFTINAGKTAAFDVSTAGAVFTVSGISNPTADGLSKSGAGILNLTGTQIYTGPTAVNGGVLRVNGGLDAASAVTVANTAGLGGTGPVNGTVTVQSGGKLAPGNSVGTLTVNALDLNTGSALEYEFSAGGATNDQTVVASAGGLALNGGVMTLLQENTSTPFSDNGTYNLIDYSGTYTGAISNLTVANPQIGKYYDVVDDTVGTVIKLAISDALSTEWNNGSADNEWTTGGNWTAGTANGLGTLAKFAALAPGGTVTNMGAKTVGTVVFDNAAGYTITGTDPVTLQNGIAAAAVSTVTGSHALNTPLVLGSNLNALAAAGTTLTLGGDISGAGKSLSATGPGTVILKGTNTYGATNVNAGTLNVGGGGTTGTLGSGAVTLASGTSLVLSRTDDSLVPNNLLGAGSVTQTGTPGFFTTYSGVNTVPALNVTSGGARFTGATTFAPTTVSIGATGMLDLNEVNTTIGGLSGVAGAIVTDNGASATTTTLTVNQAAATTYSGTIEEGAGQSLALTKTGAGTLTLDGTSANTYLGATTVTGGSLILQKSGVNAIASNAIQIGDAVGSDLLGLGASNQIADAAVLTLTAGGSGNSAFFHLNGFDETIRGINSTVGAAAVLANNSATLPSTLTIDTQGGNYAYDGIIRNGAAGLLNIVKNGAGTQTFANTAVAAADSQTGTTTVNAGTIELLNLTLWASPIVLNATTPDALLISQTTRDGTGTGNVNGVISGPGGVTKKGSFTATLFATNTFSGGLTVNEGILALGGAAGTTPAGTGTITMNGGNIRAATTGKTATNPVTVNNSFILGRLTNLRGAVTLTTDATITASNPDGVANNPSQLGAIDGAFRVSFAEGSGGAVAPFGIGTGALEITAANTNSGGTTVASGRVRVLAAGALSNAPLAVNAGELLLNNAAQTVTELAGAGGSIITGTGHTLTVNQTSTTTSAAAISGPGALVKSDTGSLTLTGATTYTGSTSVSNGTLALGAAATLSTSPVVTVSAGATLDASAAGLFRAAGQTLAGAGAITGAVTNDGKLLLALAATPGAQDPLDISGALTLTAGNTVEVTAAAAPGLGVYKLATAAGGITGTLGAVTLPGGATGTVVVSGNDLLYVNSPYATWRNAKFGTYANTGNAADGADPDLDGLSNLVEYALGGTPIGAAPGDAASDQTKLPVAALEGTNLTLTYTRVKAAVTEGWLFIIEISDNVDGPWSATGASETILGDDGILQQVKASIPLPGAGDPRDFARLRIVLP